MIRQDLHDSLKSAARMCIIAGNRINDIRLSKWAETYGCSEGHVADMWEHELTKLSRQPSNAFEDPSV